MSDYDEFHRLGLKLKFAYSIFGLVVGLVCIIVGLILGLAGTAGHTTWAASALGLSTNITDAAPGVIVFVVGIFMVFITRFKVKETSSRTTRIDQAEPEPKAKAKAKGETLPEPRRGGGTGEGNTELATHSLQYRKLTSLTPDGK